GQNTDVRSGLPDARAAIGRNLWIALSGRDAVGGQAGHGDLHADVPPTRLLGRDHRLFHILKRAAVGVPIGVDRIAALATEELIDRQAGALADDVPQRHVHAA